MEVLKTSIDLPVGGTLMQPAYSTGCSWRLDARVVGSPEGHTPRRDGPSEGGLRASDIGVGSSLPVRGRARRVEVISSV